LIFKQLTATSSSSEDNASVVKVEEEPPTNEAAPTTISQNNNNNNNKAICDSSNVISSSSVKPAKRKETGRNRKNKEFKPLISEETLQKIREGWTLANVGDLTVGDLYVMFGKELTLTLEYRWRDDKPKEAVGTPVVTPNPLAKIKSRKALERARLLSLRRPEDTVGERLKQLLAIASLSEKVKRRPSCFCNHSCDSRLNGDTDLNPVLLSDGVFKQPAIPVRNLPTYYPDSYRLNPTYHHPSMRFRQTARWANNRSPRKGLKIMPLIKVVPPRVDNKNMLVTATTTSATVATSTSSTSVSTSTEMDSVSCFYEKAMEQEGNSNAAAKDDVNKVLEERIYRLKDRMTATATAKNVVEDFDDASIKRLLYDSSSNLSYPAMYDLSKWTKSTS
jgi:hypothetical protein